MTDQSARLQNWFQIISNVAIIVGLALVIYEIRQNSLLLRVSTTAAVAASDIEFSKLLVTDPDLSRIVGEGLMDREVLSESERLRFDNFLDMMLRVFKRDYYFAQDGAIKDSVWQGERQSYLLTFQQAGARQWWSETQAQKWFGDEFRNYVNGLIREGEAAE
jgi:hypothetical protein